MIAMSISIAVVLLSAFILCFTWSYRGGSLHWKWLPSLPRVGDLLATPLFIGTAVVAALWPLTLFQWGMLVLGIALYTAAQAPGWGRQMDLGRDSGRDDEWGWQIRDMIFGKEPPILDEHGNQPIDWKGRPMHQGNYYRDLTGLYMRMAWFIFPAIAWWFVNPLVSIIAIVTWLGAPIVWMIEYKIFNKYGYGAPNAGEASPVGSSWVEFYVGVMIALTTLLVSLAILFL